MLKEQKKEDGLSIKELALILYPNLVTVNEMLAGKKDLTWIKIIMPVVNRTKNRILSFRKWTLEERNALADDFVFIMLYPRKTKISGEWLYYNVEDPNECREMD